MTTEEKFDDLNAEIEGVNFRVIASMIDDPDEGQNGFTYLGQRFVNEIEIYPHSSKAKMETYHLTKSQTIFGQWNKEAVVGTHASFSMDKTGQVYGQAEGMGKKLMIEDFIELYVDNYPNSIINCIKEWENQKA